MTERPPNPSNETDPPRGRIETEYDWDTTPPSSAIVQTLSAATAVDPADLPPLYEFVDPNAIDSLVGDAGGPDTSADLQVSFDYVTHEFHVTDGGQVVAKPLDT